MPRYPANTKSIRNRFLCELDKLANSGAGPRASASTRSAAPEGKARPRPSRIAARVRVGIEQGT